MSERSCCGAADRYYFFSLAECWAAPPQDLSRLFDRFALQQISSAFKIDSYAVMDAVVERIERTEIGRAVAV